MRHHKPSGRAVVTLNVKDRYLGKFGSAEATEAYHTLLLDWNRAGRNVEALEVRQESTAAVAAGDTLNVEEVIAAFWPHAQRHYRRKDGEPTGQADNFIHPLRVLRRLFGTTPAADFLAGKLKKCRAAVIEMGWCRNNVNRSVGRIRQVFKWAVSEEMIPASTLTSLQTVQGLEEGRSDARETDEVEPVAEMQVRAAIANTNRHVAAMLELQWITGMRSGELTIMRTADLDCTTEIWTYTPTRHKTQHRGHTRTIYLGKRAQEILTPFLKLNPTAYVFSPADADAERRADASEKRKTRPSCGNKPESNRKTKPARKPGDRYTTISYAFAVAKACDRAFPLPDTLKRTAVASKGKRKRLETLAEWRARLGSDAVAETQAWTTSHRFHPHQLRHAAATRWERDHDLDTTRALLGQRTLKAARIYAKLDMTKARGVMAVSE